MNLRLPKAQMLEPPKPTLITFLRSVWKLSKSCREATRRSDWVSNLQLFQFLRCILWAQLSWCLDSWLQTYRELGYLTQTGQHWVLDADGDASRINCWSSKPASFYGHRKFHCWEVCVTSGTRPEIGESIGCPMVFCRFHLVVPTEAVAPLGIPAPWMRL